MNCLIKMAITNKQFEIEKITDKEWEIISNENMAFYHEQIENGYNKYGYDKDGYKKMVMIF